MKQNNKIIKSYLLVTVLVCLAFLGLKAPSWYNMFKGQQAIAAGGFPAQFGLTGVVMTQCTCIPPACNGCQGGTLCPMATPPCAYMDVMGAPAGGNGANILLSNDAVNAIGLTPGGQVIAAGASNVLMQVSASAAGFFVGP